MGFVLLLFIALCGYWFIRSLLRIFGTVKPKKKAMVFTPAPKVDIPLPPAPVTNIQNNHYHHTQVVIYEAPKK